MVIKQNPIPNTSFREAIFVKRLGEYIASGEYQQAVDLLQQIQHTGSASNNFLVNCLMQSAKHLCFAAAQTKTEIEQYRVSLNAAENRQSNLEEEITAVIEIIDAVFVLENGKLPALPVLQSSNVEQQKLAPPSGRLNTIINFFTGKPAADQSVSLPQIDPLYMADYRLEVYTLGTFQVYCNGVLVENWSSRKGTHIFKYLLLNRERPIHKEVLMEQFWPDSDAESQRNNLNVAIYGLRQVLRESESDFSHVLFQNDCYFLNPEVDIWIDADAFSNHYKAAQKLVQQDKAGAAIVEYVAAEMLYEGCFLPEDTYEDWTEILRQSLQMDYLDTLDHLSRHYLETSDYAACASICQKMIAVEKCSEEAHVRLMRCYRRQGQVHLALRQYDRFVKVLETEFGIEPSPETNALYECIRKGEPI